jgi:DNA topoisomerase IA
MGGPIDRLVITGRTSQAKDVRAAVGSRYGAIVPVEGHLFDLVEPQEVVRQSAGMLTRKQPRSLPARAWL